MAFIAFVATLCTWLRLMFLNRSFLPILTKTQTDTGMNQSWARRKLRGTWVWKCESENVSLSLFEKSWHGAPRIPIVSDLLDTSKQHCFLCRMQSPVFLNFTSEGAMSRSSGTVFVINSMMSQKKELAHHARLKRNLSSSTPKSFENLSRMKNAQHLRQRCNQKLKNNIWKSLHLKHIASGSVFGSGQGGSLRWIKICNYQVSWFDWNSNFKIKLQAKDSGFGFSKS